MKKQAEIFLTEEQLKGFDALIKYYNMERRQGRDNDNLVDKLSGLKAKIADGTLALREKQFQAAEFFDQIFSELSCSIQVPLQKEKATQFFNSAKEIKALLSESCMESVEGNEQIKAKVTEAVPELLTGIDFSFWVSDTLNGVSKFFKGHLKQLQSNFNQFLLEVKDDTMLFSPLVEIYIEELQQYEFKQSRKFLIKFLGAKPQERKNFIERLCSSDRMSLLHTHMEEKYGKKFSALSSELKNQGWGVKKEDLGFDLKAIADDSALSHFKRFFEISMVVYGEGLVAGQQFKKRVCQFFKRNVSDADLEVQAKQFVSHEIGQLIILQDEKNNSTSGQSKPGHLSRLDVLEIAVKNNISHAVQLKTAFSFLASHEKDQTNQSGESGSIVALYKDFFDKMNAEIEKDVLKGKIDHMTLSGKKVSEDDLTKVNAALEAALKKNMTSCFEGIDGLGQFDSEIKVHKDQYLLSGNFSNLSLTKDQEKLSKLMVELEQLLSQAKQVLTGAEPLTALLSQVAYDKVKELSSEIESKRKSLNEIKDTLKEGLSKAGELKSIISLFTSIDTYQQAAAALKIANEHLQDKVIEHNKAYSVLKAQALPSIKLSATELKAPTSHTAMTVTEGLDAYISFNQLLERQQANLKTDEKTVKEYFDGEINVLCDQAKITVQDGDTHADQVEVIQKAVNNKITEYHKQFKTLKDFSSTVEIAATEIDLVLFLSSETLDQRITRLMGILDNLNMQQEKLKQGTSLLLKKVKEIESSLDIKADYSVEDMSDCLNNIWGVLDKRIREYNKKAECFAKRKAIVNSQSIPAPFSELKPNLLPEIGGCDENQSLGVRLVDYESTVKQFKASEVELKLKIDSFEKNAKTAFDNAKSDQERLKYCLGSQLGLFSSELSQDQEKTVNFLVGCQVSISNLPSVFWDTLRERLLSTEGEGPVDSDNFAKTFSTYFSNKANEQFVLSLLRTCAGFKSKCKKGANTDEIKVLIEDLAYQDELKNFNSCLANVSSKTYPRVCKTAEELCDLVQVLFKDSSNNHQDIRMASNVLRATASILGALSSRKKLAPKFLEWSANIEKERLVKFRRVFMRMAELYESVCKALGDKKGAESARELMSGWESDSKRVRAYSFLHGIGRTLGSIAKQTDGMEEIKSDEVVGLPDDEQEEKALKK